MSILQYPVTCFTSRKELIRTDVSGYVRIRQDTSGYVSIFGDLLDLEEGIDTERTVVVAYVSIRQRM